MTSPAAPLRQVPKTIGGGRHASSPLRRCARCPDTRRRAPRQQPAAPLRHVSRKLEAMSSSSASSGATLNSGMLREVLRCEGEGARGPRGRRAGARAGRQSACCSGRQAAPARAAAAIASGRRWTAGGSKPAKAAAARQSEAGAAQRVPVLVAQLVVKVLADLFEDGRGDLREVDGTELGLGEGAWAGARRGGAGQRQAAQAGG
jgi:hypothetical protein